MLNRIKRSLLTKYISGNVSDRKKQLISLQRAKSIGIIASISDEESYRNIFSLFSLLQNGNKSVRMVAYIDDKTVPYFCLEQLTADYFCRKDLNWYGKPVMVQVNDFMAMDFDLLIDFTDDFYLPVYTILQLSKAKMITGANHHYRELYDLFIDGNGINKRTLLDNINTYSHQLTGEKI